MCKRFFSWVFVLGLSLWALSPSYGADIVWDFEGGNTHDFVLRCVNPATPAPDDPETAGDEAITGAGGPNGLPAAGVAWTVCDLYEYVGMKPAVVEGQNIANGRLVAQAALPKAAGPSSLGQMGYLNTYALSIWGDALHTAANDQIATSPRVRLGATSVLTANVIGGTGSYHAPELEADPALGYTDGSCGIAIIGTNGSLLMNVFTPAQNSGVYTMDLSSLAGQEVYVELVDAFAGGWGWIAFDQVMITDAVVTGISGKVFASMPKPVDLVNDVPRDNVVLGWNPGKFAKTHDVYMGTGFDDVNSASRNDPRGVLVSQDQAAATYDPAGLLTFGQTYYWRVDEVNAPEEPGLYKGKVWSFTVETYGYKIDYPVHLVKATASSFSNNLTKPEKTIDGSGLDGSDQHSTSVSQMWLSKKNVTPIWIQYEFDSIYKLYQMWVWNQNQMTELDFGFGAKDVTIEVSTDGSTWTVLAGVPEFAQAPGDASYVHNTTVDFGGAVAKYVRLTIANNWADGTKQAGLSEVRFFYVPVKAFEPTPTTGAPGVALDAVLNWRPGREAVKHEVSLGTDPNAMAKVATVTEHSYSLGSVGLEYGKTYYWKVNEVNDAASPSSWAGDVWSFTASGYGVVEDFESYNDLCKKIFYTWVDKNGYNASPECGGGSAPGNGSGAIVGNDTTPYADKTNRNSGVQSLPMFFDNTMSPYYSETYREWTSPEVWTGGGANTLRVYLRGDPVAFVETSPGTILMNGMGTDIWANADEFRYVYKQLSGNGSIVARVDSLTRADEWSKAGVMIRETLDAGSAHACVAATPTLTPTTHGISYQRRLVTDDVSTNTDVNMAPARLPYWVKLTRTGNVFTAQRSLDGVTWVDIVPATPLTFTMANNVYIGLAVTSHNATAVSGAKFSNVSTTGGVSGSWQVAEIGAVQVPGNIPETCYVAVQDLAGKLKVVSSLDPGMIATGNWEEWNIPLSQFTSAGVNLNSVKKLIIGIGDRSVPKAGGKGKLNIDDIRLTRVSTP